MAEKRKPPAFRVVQVGIGKNGEKEFREIGAMWEHSSQKGEVFYVLNIGKMRLLVFPRTEKK